MLGKGGMLCSRLEVFDCLSWGGVCISGYEPFRTQGYPTFWYLWATLEELSWATH